MKILLLHINGKTERTFMFKDLIKILFYPNYNLKNKHPYLDLLPDELIEIILNHILNLQDLLRVRVVCSLFYKYTSRVRIGREMLLPRYNKINNNNKYSDYFSRPFCINNECRQISIIRSTGKVYLFEYNKIEREKIGNPPFDWFFYNSSNKDEYKKGQVAVQNKVKKLKNQKKGECTCVFIPYCPYCAGDFVVRKLPPYYH